MKKLQQLVSKQFAHVLNAEKDFAGSLKKKKKIELFHNQIENEILTCLSYKHLKSYDTNKAIEKVL